MSNTFFGRSILAAIMVLAVMMAGTVGYMVFEGWSFLDALYMTSITVSTVGFGETHALSQGGRFFTIFLIFSGVGVVFYILTQVTQMVVEGKIRQVMGRKNLQRRIRSLKGHYIICGYGRIGSMVTEMLVNKGVPVVILDTSQEITTRLEEQGILYVLGSATEDENLLAAGLDRAKGLVATVSSDADNVYIVLTAKGIRPDIFVIARATEPGSERKLKRAGANKVVSPYFIGARRIAQTVIRPSVADFIDLTFHNADVALSMEELLVGKNTDLAGIPLKDSGIRQKLNLIILAIKKPDEQMIFNPDADTVLEIGDTLIAMGSKASMTKLGSMLDSGV
ncbi:potassium channel family protein [Dethiosulfatarculus sandiegensis]|uniref:Potassium transporter TrkA n=1 Tax=Dethiosulfatarculus sandiegensis TaxID=1429043 RepID=A0A0D2G8S0_9BACT|nr:potassium channel protein [Dethiosulfatarculus sandiegensis]KIX11317.1 potassium transporter TrkA [Dethiosulfatarculus sandiegensis]